MLYSRFSPPIRRPGTRPLGPCIINWNHPDAAGLFDCIIWNDGFAHNLVGFTDPTLTGAPTAKITREGYGGYTTGGTSFDVADHGQFYTGPFTFRVRFIPVTWPGNFCVIVDKGINSSNRSFSVLFDTSGNIDFVQIGNQPGSVAITTGFTAGAIADLLITISSGTTATVYANGVSVGTMTIGTSSLAAAPMSFGRNPTTGGVLPDAVYLTSQTWSRGMSAQDAARLYADPYGFLMPRMSQRSIVGVAAAGGSFIPAWAMNSNLPVLGTGTY